MDEQVIVVDENDNQVGLMEKLEAHKGNGVLHRAISVLLYRKKNGKTEALLQQRSKSKLLWPLYWTNTVCTHPRNNESYEDCAVRRLKEEMGIEIQKSDLKFVFRLKYQARYTAQYSEHELDSVYVGKWDRDIRLNPDEAKDYRWIEWNVLLKETKMKSDPFTPWFKKMVNYLGKRTELRG